MTSITEDTEYGKNVHLDLTTANLRFDTVADVSYKVDLQLPKGEWYTGSVQIEFNCKKIPTDDFFLDFRGIKVANLKINEHEPIADFFAHKLQLPS